VNKLYFGDNLDVMREYLSKDSIDLIYLDPPFNSQAHYNILFRTPQEQRASAQAGAFRDTWLWGEEAERSYASIMRQGGAAARILDALRGALGESDMMAYMAMMTGRLVELQRVLKPTGSLYLHCDPTASHYLKIVMDSIFGDKRFQNEIKWKRTHAHGDSKGRYANVTDHILFYSKGETKYFERQMSSYSEEYIKKYFRYSENGRLYQLVSLRSPKPRPNLSYTYKGVEPHQNGWAVSREKMEQLDREGRLRFPEEAGQTIREKYYLDEMKGVPITDLWDDIAPINSQAKERLPYPTQKPLALLERIVTASSRAGDLVLDPFCGCGTTIEAAERLQRQWIGIDIAIHAIKVIEGRLGKLGKPVVFGLEGMPRDFASALRLAERDKYQFQWWANYLFNPHALREQKKGADRGIDGEMFFPNGPGRPWGKILTSVKGGEHVNPGMVRDFAHVLQRDGASLGLFICLRRPTDAMTREAVSVGFADVVHGDIQRLQIVAIEEWFEGRRPVLPPLEHLPSAAFSALPRSAEKRRPDLLQPELPLSFVGGKTDSSVVRHFNPRMVSVAS
jgi:site-specific DNA-methyltransferase (adenine-specific)